MIKVLFICHGNICRSPMAEFVMKQMVFERGMEHAFLINSAATSREEIGNSIYFQAQRKLKAERIPYEDHRAIQVTKQDYQKYDLLIVMDENNRINLRRIIGEDKENKVHMLLSYAGMTRDVADPWYTGDFDCAFDDIKTGCEALLKTLLKDKDITNFVK